MSKEKHRKNTTSQIVSQDYGADEIIKYGCEYRRVRMEGE